MFLSTPPIFWMHQGSMDQGTCSKRDRPLVKQLLAWFVPWLFGDDDDEIMADKLLVVWLVWWFDPWVAGILIRVDVHVRCFCPRPRQLTLLCRTTRTTGK